MIKQQTSYCKSTWGWLQAIINTLNCQKILIIFLKLCPALDNYPINIKILIISAGPIWVIFQNSVTYDVWYCKRGSQFVIKFSMSLLIPGQNKMSFAWFLLFTMPRYAVLIFFNNSSLRLEHLFTLRMILNSS